MKKRKWLAALLVVVLLAAGTAVAGWLIVRANRISLYDYALSLPAEDCFVDRDGQVWREKAHETDPPFLPLQKTEQAADAAVSLRLPETSDRAFTVWEYALYCGGLIRQDGSFWAPRSGGSRDFLTVRPFLTEAPKHEKGEREDVSIHFRKIEHYSSSPSNDPISVKASIIMPDELKSKRLTLYSSVRLEDKWYRLHEMELKRQGYDFYFTILPVISPGNYRRLPWQVPPGSYRLELYDGDEPVHFLNYRVSWEGTTITLTEE